MKVQINTDHSIEGREAMTDHFRSVVESGLSRISDHLTRVEAHLSEENRHKGSRNEKCCMMEARLQGRQPIAVNHRAATMTQAVEGALDRLTRLIGSTLERLRDERIRRTDPVSNEQEWTSRP